ncbi:M64 family metallopeptidase [Fontivita pretiosa]|uniref:M64 family metallopeptidase n=1 Tax=Fontivita pretiosa TaxID=2989684 RepID=UPI003D179081
MPGTSKGLRHLLGFTSVAVVCLVCASPLLAIYTTVVNNGPSANRVDMVFLGDGYRAADISTIYSAHINAMLRHFFDEGENPFPRYRNFFNVHRIDVISNQAGADVPPLGIYRDTALDARYYYDGVTERLLYVNESKANAALASGLSGAGFSAEMKLITVNDTRYGGGGGAYAVYAGGNPLSTEIALHELGHSFSRLADEYGGNSGTYTGAEPNEVNVTKDPTGAKWAHWLGYDQPGIGLIGAYEGGRYWDRGIYRPSLNSKMRSLNRPFDAIAREKIILDIYNYVDPLDTWTSNLATLVDPDTIMVDVVDPAVIDVQWYIDGTLLAEAAGELFDPQAWNLPIGLHQVMARAYDPTDWVRSNRWKLEQSVSWSVLVTVPEPHGLAGMLMGLAMLYPSGRTTGRSGVTRRDPLCP